MVKYESQALAIVFAILIVGSIVGFALYSRLSRESVRIVDEKSSAESHELVETVIGLLNSAGYEKVKDDQVLSLLVEGEGDFCNENKLESEGCRVSGLDLSDLDLIFESMDLVDTGIKEFMQDLEEDYCLTELSFKSSSSEGITIEQDDVYSVFFDEVSWEEGNCNGVNFEMDSINNDATGFVMSTFYVERDEEKNILRYKPYEFEDVFGFKYGDIVDGDNWVKYSPDLLTFNLDKSSKSFEDMSYKLDEVRFKSLGGSSILSWSTEGSCSIKDHLLVEVGATCGDKYVGKSFILPEEYFAPPMFDYVYYQGLGDLN